MGLRVTAGTVCHIGASFNRTFAAANVKQPVHLLRHVCYGPIRGAKVHYVRDSRPGCQYSSLQRVSLHCNGWCELDVGSLPLSYQWVDDIIYHLFDGVVTAVRLIGNQLILLQVQSVSQDGPQCWELIGYELRCGTQIVFYL